MGPDRLTAELLERCHKAFIMWDQNLFSFPIDLPGFGRSAGHPQQSKHITTAKAPSHDPWVLPASQFSMQTELLQWSIVFLDTQPVLPPLVAASCAHSCMPHVMRQWSDLTSS